jgi:hypothetical protein
MWKWKRWGASDAGVVAAAVAFDVSLAAADRFLGS